jgi:hypothetical protein
MKQLALVALLAVGCVPTVAIQGTARLDEHSVVTLCESGETYDVTITTSNAAFDWDAARERARAEGSVYVEVAGHESTASPSARPTADRRMSIGAIRALDARPDGC